MKSMPDFEAVGPSMTTTWGSQISQPPKPSPQNLEVLGRCEGARKLLQGGPAVHSHGAHRLREGSPDAMLIHHIHQGDEAVCLWSVATVKTGHPSQRQCVEALCQGYVVGGPQIVAAELLKGHQAHVGTCTGLSNLERSSDEHGHEKIKQ